MASTAVELLRRRFGRKSLPYDAKVEYLSSTSNATQYIDTGVVPNSNTGIQIVVYRYNTSDSYMCGLRDTTNTNTRWCIGNPGYYGYGNYGGIRSIPVNTQIIYNLNYLNDGTFNTPEYGSAVTLPTLPFTPVNNIRLFGSAGISASYSKWYGRIYEVKITQGNILAMHLIPVRVGTTGYMYDKVSGQLFGNAGTGDFILGNDI